MTFSSTILLCKMDISLFARG